MKFTKFLSAFLSLFFILIGMEKAFGMEAMPLSGKANTTKAGQCGICKLNSKYMGSIVNSASKSEPIKVCGWNCVLRYVIQGLGEFRESNVRVILRNVDCCTSERKYILKLNDGTEWLRISYCNFEPLGQYLKSDLEWSQKMIDHLSNDGFPVRVLEFSLKNNLWANKVNAWLVEGLDWCKIEKLLDLSIACSIF